MKLSGQGKERVKQIEDYIRIHKIFPGYKLLPPLYLVLGGVLYWLGSNFWETLGLILISIAVIFFFRKESYKDGFSDGFDEGTKGEDDHDVENE